MPHEPCSFVRVLARARAALDRAQRRIESLAPAAAIFAWVALFLCGFWLAQARDAQPPLYRVPDWLEVDSTAENAGVYTWLRSALGTSTGWVRLPAKLLFVIVACIAIAIARRWPKRRDLATVVLGAAWVSAAVGPAYAASMLTLTVLIYATGRRLNPHLCMAVTTLLLLAIYRIVPMNRSWSTCALFASCRLIMYAFEVSTVPNRRRSLLTTLAYSPVGLLLWPSEPPMTSYITYATPRDRGLLDKRGATQLVRSGAKYVALEGVLAGLTLCLPFGAIGFSGNATGVMVALVAAPVVFYLRVSFVADLAYGLSSLAGYDAPDAFDFPLLAKNPIVFWQTWNIPVMSFLRRVFIFPVARRYRSLFPTILAGMVGSAFIHIVFGVIFVARSVGGHALTWSALLAVTKAEVLGFATLGGILVLGIPFYRARAETFRATHVVQWFATQLLMAVALFPTFRFVDRSFPATYGGSPFAYFYEIVKPLIQR